MKKLSIISTVLVLAVLFVVSSENSIRAAEVIVKVAPPPPVSVAVVGRAPSARHVWIPGYHAWKGGRYVWIPGHWMIPPRPGVVWVAPRWVHRGGGYVFVAGFWR